MVYLDGMVLYLIRDCCVVLGSELLGRTSKTRNFDENSLISVAVITSDSNTRISYSFRQPWFHSRIELLSDVFDISTAVNPFFFVLQSPQDCPKIVQSQNSRDGRSQLRSSSSSSSTGTSHVLSTACKVPGGGGSLRSSVSRLSCLVDVWAPPCFGRDGRRPCSRHAPASAASSLCSGSPFAFLEALCALLGVLGSGNCDCL